MAAGLLASGAALTTSMKDRLIAREDQNLRQVADGFARPRNPDKLPPVPKNDHRPPTRYYVVTYRTDGTSVNIGGNPDFTVRPDLSRIGELGDDATTVHSEGGGGPLWRVVESRSEYGYAYVAVKLSDVTDTMSQLMVLEVLIGVSVLLVAGGLGYLVVRKSLTPLENVERTAEAIAAGDLTSRVPAAPSGTEVGSLSESINAMLHQIQDSFARVEASEESARRGEERMRRFIGDASHELRTPLTSIRGFAELYRQGATDDVDFLMRHIESEAQRMGLLVEDLLLLARLDARRPLAHRPVDLMSVATDVVHAAQAREPERDIALNVEPAAVGVTVPGDQDRIVQVVTNLVSNALRHTPDDAHITVRVAAEPDSAIIEVRDTGDGMTPDEAARAFERFYRTDSSRSRGSGGAGLGLSIVHGIVQAHEGTVHVETAPGEGAAFIVRLPRVRPHVSEAELAAVPIDTVAPTAPGTYP
ncbi:HAMP domain-containing sensor histidine kinase [Tsukamurella sp. 8F]|nr:MULTISPECIES: HAMP domain-containing sensor histidine kinase [unclassified Tsukamurella]MDF0528344.1 HAMP domain-containing sensor histidine kinase [Tsukamurella sp. 8J]MDF0586169.1 HAMP domain-containing sensor histidine kinase [Tsukamurella sp. 8F]